MKDGTSNHLRRCIHVSYSSLYVQLPMGNSVETQSNHKFLLFMSFVYLFVLMVPHNILLGFLFRFFYSTIIRVSEMTLFTTKIVWHRSMKWTKHTENKNYEEINLDITLWASYEVQMHIVPFVKVRIRARRIGHIGFCGANRCRINNKKNNFFRERKLEFDVPRWLALSVFGE